MLCYALGPSGTRRARRWNWQTNLLPVYPRYSCAVMSGPLPSYPCRTQAETMEKFQQLEDEVQAVRDKLKVNPGCRPLGLRSGLQLKCQW